jgi:hypothetical protein
MQIINKIKTTSFILLLSALFHSTNAQIAESIRCLSFIKDNSIILRWVPESVPVWQAGNKYGYIVKRYTIARNGLFIPDGLNNGESLTNQPIMPFSNESFDSLAVIDPHASIVHEAIYGNGLISDNMSSDFIDFHKVYQESEMRFGFALFMCDMSPAIAKAAGLQFTDKNITKGERYAYSISLANIPDGMQVEPGVVVADAGKLTILPPVSEVSTVFLDKAVRFRWPVTFHKGIFTAYVLEKSLDGRSYLPISDLPLVNFSEAEDQDYFFFTDSLDRNDQQVWYRIKGLSPFGEIGPPSEIIKGKGRPDFSAYASIDSAIVIQNNRITIKWRLSESISMPVKSIDMLRSEAPDGPFEQINKKPLNAKTRTFIDAHPLRTNYYQVKLTGGEELISYSFPYFVQTEDNDPPLPPQNLSGKVDSSGVVTIIWEKNKEPDLLGYKIFRANSSKEELVPLNKGIIIDNICYDSINLNTLTSKICYQVVALDKNYNSSNFSAVLELTRPDTIAPSPAIIKMLTAENDKVIIRMEESPSRDVDHYDLTRQLVNDTTVHKVTAFKEKFIEEWLEDPPLVGGEYSYSLITYDKSGNRSVNSRKTIIKSAQNDQFDLEAIQSPDGKRITLKWELPTGFIPERTIIFRSISLEPLTVYKTLEGNDKYYIDVDVQINVPYNYRLMVFNRMNEGLIGSRVLHIFPDKK